jgi:hypothetical protein
MHVVISSFLAASFSSLANLFFRKSSDRDSTANAYLTCYYLISFLSSFLFYPELLSLNFNFIILCIGIVAGVLNVILMQLIFHTLRCGPAGLTFAFQNASSLFPNLILFLIFGQSFFVVNGYQIMGMLLILGGMVLATQTHESTPCSKRWILWACVCCLLQIFILMIFHWRCLFYQQCSHILVPVSFAENEDAWFMPGLAGSAWVFQTLLFLRERRWLKTPELLFGTFGGLANGIGTFLLLLATRWAAPLEKGLVFPLFAVGVIVFCNLWGYKLYQERIPIKANALCIIGILIAALG